MNDSKTPNFEITISFTDKEHLNNLAIALLDDCLAWSFTVVPTSDSSKRHMIKIHETFWAENISRLGRIVEEVVKEE